jgi:hypothetical protein
MMAWVHTLTVGDWLAVTGLPLLVLGYLEAFTKYGPKMAGLKRPLGFLFLGVAVFAYVADLADRFGAFGPTKAELAIKNATVTSQYAALEKKRAHLQGAVDYWHQQSFSSQQSTQEKKVQILRTVVKPVYSPAPLQQQPSVAPPPTVIAEPVPSANAVTTPQRPRADIERLSAELPVLRKIIDQANPITNSFGQFIDREPSQITRTISLAEAKADTAAMRQQFQDFPKR